MKDPERKGLSAGRARARRPAAVLGVVAAVAALLSCALVEGAMAEERPLVGFGPELPIVRELGIGGCMDAAVVGHVLYVIGGGSLYAADITTPAEPTLIGRLGGLGFVRQVEVSEGIAYVTARADGLFVVDVHEPAAPKLLAHYDTVELATGVAVEGPLLAVANRHYGVEFVDVSDPRRPRFLGLVRVGEAQSVALRDGIAYAGVWAQRQVVICDARNPREPSVIARANLDGFGDGVFVEGNLCYAATGHHARGLRNHFDPNDPMFGKGHGLELIDVSDPKQPKTLSGVKFPPFYNRFIDMWDVQVCGRYAFVGDTFGGLFGVDVSDTKRPLFAGHLQLPEVPKRGMRGPIGGFALGKGVVYVAGAWTDLHVIGARGMAAPIPPRRASARPTWSGAEPKESPSVYRPGGQAHAASFAPDGDLAFVAAGAAGLHIVRLRPRMEKVGALEAQDFVFDAAVSGSRLYVAEGLGGLSVWDCSQPAALKLLGRYQPKEGRVFQVMVPSPGRHALLHVGEMTLQIVDVSDPAAMRVVCQEKHDGLLYRLPLADGSLNERYTGCLWHASGFYWYDLKAEPTPAYAGHALQGHLSANSGMAFIGGRALAIVDGGYALLDPPQSVAREEAQVVKLPVPRAGGKPTVYGNRLYLSGRWDGSVLAFDVSDLAAPKLLWQRHLPGNPGLIRERDGVLLIPAGNQGLLVCDPKTGEPLYGE